jgi:multidrug efflux pump subunit AcrA (membrane-fusion protein)
MKRTIHLSLVALILSMAFSCKQKDTWVQPVYAPITEALFASGHIEPVNQFVLTSVSEGYLRDARVKESDVVRPGDVLFTLDNSTGNITEQSAKENLQIARQNASSRSPVLQKLRADLRTAEQKRELDSLQYQRLKKLYETRSIAQVDLDNMRLQYEQDINLTRSIRENISASTLSLQQALVQAESQYNTSNTGNQYYTLKASQAARVYQVFKKPGELVRKGDGVALLGSADSLVVMLFVDEAGISKVRIGQKVLVELNTSKGTTYQASVTRLYPYFDSASQSFKVEAVFNDPLKRVIAGTLLQANIVVGRKDTAMLIPRSCLQADGTITVKRNGDRKTVPLQTGIVSTEWVEVLGGIDIHDEVLQAF